MKVVRAADQTRIRWRNDGGWTRDIARDSPHEHDFSWRISIADVETDGPFSHYEGFDRLLVLLDGAGMDLVVADNGETMRLRPSTPSAWFSGEVTINAELLDGPTTDFNVIWDRSRFFVEERADWRERAVVAQQGVRVVAHVLSGVLETDVGVRGVVGDTLIGDTGEGVRLSGEGDAIVVLIAARPAIVDAKRND